jgi:hypothetical protein
MTLDHSREAVWFPTGTNRMRPSSIIGLGDATVFHFAAAQFSLGAVPYRDFIDMEMPLIYAIHAAVIAIGGMGDLTFRIFDLGSSVSLEHSQRRSSGRRDAASEC